MVGEDPHHQERTKGKEEKGKREGKREALPLQSPVSRGGEMVVAVNRVRGRRGMERGR